MRARNGATFGELRLLRALDARGGSASMAELSALRMKGIPAILERMLPARSRQRDRPDGKPVPDAASMKAKSTGRSRKNLKGGERIPLLAKTSVRGLTVFSLRPAAIPGSRHAGPWKVVKNGWEIVWTPSDVRVTMGGDLIGRFSAHSARITGGLNVAEGMDLKVWGAFRREMLEKFGIRVPQEAAPDGLVFPDGFRHRPAESAPPVKNKAARTERTAQV